MVVSVGPASAYDCHSGGREFAPRSSHITFVETGHEIISKAILILPLIQVGRLPLTGERICTLYWLIA